MRYAAIYKDSNGEERFSQALWTKEQVEDRIAKPSWPSLTFYELVPIEIKEVTEMVKVTRKVIV